MKHYEAQYDQPSKSMSRSRIEARNASMILCNLTKSKHAEVFTRRRPPLFQFKGFRLSGVLSGPLILFKYSQSKMLKRGAAHKIFLQPREREFVSRSVLDGLIFHPHRLLIITYLLYQGASWKLVCLHNSHVYRRTYLS